MLWQVSSNDVEALVQNTFFLSRDDLRDREFAAKLSPRISLNLDSSQERDYPEHLLTEILITILSNAARYTATCPKSELPLLPPVDI